jgi:hypothetical protein
MQTPRKASTMADMKVRLSTLWIFVMFNYIYADIMTFYEPGIIESLMQGSVGGLEMTPGFLLSAAILMEIPIAMIVLSRLLNYRSNRIANILAGIIKTAAVFVSMFVGKPSLHYLFFGTIEIACTLLIVWFAWRWTENENS